MGLSQATAILTTFNMCLREQEALQFYGMFANCGTLQVRLPTGWICQHIHVSQLKKKLG